VPSPQNEIGNGFNNCLQAKKGGGKPLRNLEIFQSSDAKKWPKINNNIAIFANI
jgi:hypothetical protein